MIYLVVIVSGMVAGFLIERFEARASRAAARRELLEALERAAARTGDSRVKLFARAFADDARGLTPAHGTRGPR